MTEGKTQAIDTQAPSSTPSLTSSKKKSTHKHRTPKKANEHLSQDANIPSTSARLKTYRAKLEDENCIGGAMVVWTRIPNSNLMTKIRCILESGHPVTRGVASDIDDESRKFNFAYDLAKQKAMVIDVLTTEKEGAHAKKKKSLKPKSLLHPGVKRIIPQRTTIVDREKEIEHIASTILKTNEKHITRLTIDAKLVEQSLRRTEEKYIKAQEMADHAIEEIRKKQSMIAEKIQTDIKNLNVAYNPDPINEVEILVRERPQRKAKIAFV